MRQDVANMFNQNTPAPTFEASPRRIEQPPRPVPRRIGQSPRPVRGEHAHSELDGRHLLPA